MSTPPLAAFSPTEFTISHEESIEHNIALSIFVSYFAITFVLFRVVSLSLADAYKRAKREGERATLDATLSLKESSDIWVTWKRKLVRMKTFLVIALLSYLHTWFCKATLTCRFIYFALIPLLHQQTCSNFFIGALPISNLPIKSYTII